jgi:hypothetical protein
MRIILPLLTAVLSVMLPALHGAEPRAPKVTRDIPCAGVQSERRMLDVYAPPQAKSLPAIFWVHGGGWRKGGKSGMDHKPPAFTDEKLRDLSSVNHFARGKSIPSLLLVHVGDHPDKGAQPIGLRDALTTAGLPVKTFAAPATDPVRINANLGQPDDPATKAVLKFLAEVMNRKQ